MNVLAREWASVGALIHISAGIKQASELEAVLTAVLYDYSSLFQSST